MFGAILRCSLQEKHTFLDIIRQSVVALEKDLRELPVKKKRGEELRCVRERNACPERGALRGREEATATVDTAGEAGRGDVDPEQGSVQGRDQV